MSKYKHALEMSDEFGWVFLKSIALLYPINPTIRDKESYSGFFMDVGKVLPFAQRLRYNERLTKHPMKLNNPHDLAEWVNEMHGCTPFMEFIDDYLPPSMYNRLGLAEQPLEKTNHVYKIQIQSWGPAGWEFLKTIALTYPPTPTIEDKETYQRFFTRVGQVLPCQVCRNHYNDNLPLNPIRLDSTKELAWWINEMHNRVLLSQNKKIIPFLSFIADYVPPCMYQTVGLTKDEQKKAKSFLCILKQKHHRYNPYLQSIVILLTVMIILSAFGFALTKCEQY
jgi:hypothetical protein